MALNLEDLIEKIVQMAETSQKARGIDNFGSEGFKNNQERAYQDSRNDVRDKAIFERDKLRDTLSAQRDRDNLANPMSLLSGQEQRMQLFEDLKQKNALYPGALNAQTKENELKTAQAAQAQGAANYYTGSGALSQAKADTQNMLNPIFNRLPNQDQARVLFERTPLAGLDNTAPQSQVATPLQVAPAAVTPSYTATTVGVTPEEQALFANDGISQNTLSQTTPGLFGGMARGAISTIDTIGDLGSYFRDSALSFRRNLKKSRPNIFAVPPIDSY